MSCRKNRIVVDIIIGCQVMDKFSSLIENGSVYCVCEHQLLSQSWFNIVGAIVTDIRCVYRLAIYIVLLASCGALSASCMSYVYIRLCILNSIALGKLN